MENVKDIDGNSYKTVRIGDQIWMAENLKVTQYRYGQAYIWNITGDDKFYERDEGAFCNYNNIKETTLVDIYGRLYNWYAVNDKRGLAPRGWHVPTDEEWQDLCVFLGDLAGGKLKTTGMIENGSGLWHKPNIGATNESGFNALPGGIRGSYKAGCKNIGYDGYFWSSSDYRGGATTAWSRKLSCDNTEITRSNHSKSAGYSVRCIRD